MTRKPLVAVERGQQVLQKRNAILDVPIDSVSGRLPSKTVDVFASRGRVCITPPEPRRGDLVAIPVTGAYTLAMSSTYNAVPRPAVVLVSGGDATVIRRRETVRDLLALEA